MQIRAVLHQQFSQSRIVRQYIGLPRLNLIKNMLIEIFKLVGHVFSG